MRIINSAAMAFLAVIAAAPALAQDAEVFVGSICEIDTAPLGVSGSTFTFNSQKDCAGTASKRNMKLTCTANLGSGWTLGNRSAKGFPCTINPDQCGVTAKPSDTANPPYVTTRDSLLKVQSRVATLTCFYKP